LALVIEAPAVVGADELPAAPLPPARRGAQVMPGGRAAHPAHGDHTAPLARRAALGTQVAQAPARRAGLLLRTGRPAHRAPSEPVASSDPSRSAWWQSEPLAVRACSQ
jgi:hypothetical protein